MDTTTKPACCYDGPASCMGTCGYALAQQDRAERLAAR